MGWGQGRAWPILTGERAHYELAAGRDVRPYIAALEKFSSFGGMLPEQIWDYADLPSEDMYFGRAAGSAQPLVWAHAEYLKLLRSVTDNHVFDCTSVVYDRYILGRHREHFRRYLGIFQLGRPISAIVQGGVLRILDAACFSVVYTTDNWATKTQLDAHTLGSVGCFADIPVAAHQTGSIVFTLHWPEQDRWLGHDYEVAVHTVTPDQGTAAEKPKV